MSEEKAVSSRQQQKLKTRKKIKSVAKKAFSEQGIDATNTREVSARAGVAVGTFFSHFPDKVSLVKEIFFDEMTLSLNTRLDNLLGDTSMNPIEFSNSFSAVLFDFYLEQRQYAIVMLNQSLLQQDFFQVQLQVVQTSIIQRFEAIEVDATSAQIFAENMVANFQYVLLAMLAAQSFNKTPWLQQLNQLNLPFEHIYQNAFRRFQDRI